MRIRQYVYFDISSPTIPADAISAYLGIEPDEVKIQGMRRTEPPLPKLHSWQIHCRKQGIQLDEQFSAIFDRIAPAQRLISDLVTERGVATRLVIVRNFDDEGEPELFDAFISPGGKIFEKLSGQHQLLGWILDPEQLGLLASVHASIWADEYG